MTDITLITPIDMIDQFGDDEIAQRAIRDDHHEVSGDDLRVTINDGDRTGWTQDLRNQADFALDNLQSACDQSNAIASGYIRAGYPVIDTTAPTKTPLDAKRYTLDLCRFILYDDNYPEYVYTANVAALAWFRDVASGKIALDLGIANIQKPGGLVMTNLQYPLMNNDQAVH